VPNQRKFRFGVAVSFPEDAGQWRDLARKVEDLGYDVLLVADHLSRQWSPLPALVAAADVTSRLRFGTQVIANDFRHPAVLAKEAATLDLLTGGRFELGIGVGHPPSSQTGIRDYQQLGREMDSPGARVQRLAESLQIISTFFDADEPFDFAGSFFNLQGVIPHPKPLQKPRPPLMIAGAGPRMLKLAASSADIINIAPRPPTRGTTSRGSTGFGLDIHAELSIIKDAAGSRFDEIELSVFADRAVLTDKPEEELDKLAAEFGISREAVLDMPHTLIGSLESMIESLQAYRERFGISYRIVPNYMLDAFAPVVARLKGT
jgi:probable F420-dependent oxidoreductase